MLAHVMDIREHDMPIPMGLPRRHRTKLYPTNPIKRLNKDVKSRARVLEIPPTRLPFCA